MSKVALVSLVLIAVLLLAVGKWIVDGLKGIATPNRPRRVRFA
jgi:hypothetical protein